jgi:hypothetical protein
MAYIINKFSGEQLIVLEDGTIDTSTSLGLVGRNYVGYGETQNENFIYLLENFAGDSPPQRPLIGQIWFDTIANAASVYDGANWNPIGTAKLSNSAPSNANPGSLWLDTSADQLKVYNGTEWGLVGPEAVEGFGITRARSAKLFDTIGNPHAVIFFEINDIITAICTGEEFNLSPANYISGFGSTLISGINLSEVQRIQSNLIGNATSADKLSNARLINDMPFDGQSNITVKASTTNKLIKGTYILGSDFDGSSQITWSVDATSANQIGKVVARNSSGGFAAGTITADLIGNVTGNVTAASGTSTFVRVEANEFVGATLTGNARSASQLAIPRQINGINFDGTSNITVPAAAETLTGNTLNSTILASSLTSVGTLINLNVSNLGINVGSAEQLRLLAAAGSATIRALTGTLNFDIGPTGPQLSFVNAESALSLGGLNAPAIVADNLTNLGITGRKFNNIYANYFKGTDIEVVSLTPTVPNGDITANGNLIVTGNLTVQGNVTAVNSTELTIEDKLITLASGAATAAEANGAGIFINGSGASLMYSSSGNKWVFNKFLDMGSNDIVTTGLFIGTATSARYADLAENYLADFNYPAGTVLEIGGEYEVTIAKDSTNKIAGVVSTNPAFLMNSECEGKNVVAIAIQGRTPCKVKGKIYKGDMLVSAGDGFAKATDTPQFGSIIGKALEDFNGSEGIIEVFVGRI